MTRAAVAGLLVLVALSGCSGSDDDDKSPSDPAPSGTPEAAVPCTAAAAKSVERAEISRSKIEPACVKLDKGDDFTLLNVDARAHSLSTTSSSPVELQVDLRKNAAFPYRFTKVGTYTFKEATSELTLTIIVT